MSMIRVLAPLAVIAALLAVACGGDDGGATLVPASATTTTAPVTASAVASPTPVRPTELRIATINLTSPLTLDANDPVAGDTFEPRLKLLAEELKQLNPDVIGFNEASVTARGSASAYLAKELKMEPIYLRANPWFPGQSKEQSDELVKLTGFEEGELFLVRTDRWPLARDPEFVVLNPRTSETGERRIGLHIRLKAAEPTGAIDIYLTHLTGGGERIRQQQAQYFANWVEQTRGDGPVIVLGDFSETPDSAALAVFPPLGLKDVAAPQTWGTCCRESVVGDSEALTTRTDYILAGRWLPSSVALFGQKPGQRADGAPLYASDHNGLIAEFDLAAYSAPAIP